MKFLTIRILSILTLLVPLTLRAQQPMGLNQAIDEALKFNFNQLIAQNNIKIAENNSIPGNAGYLPMVSLNGAKTNNWTNTHQEYQTGNVIDRNGAKNTQLNASANLTWTIFNGMGRQVVYQQNKELLSISEVQLKLTTEQTILSVASAYYDILRQEYILSGLDTAVELARKRMQLADVKSTVGSGAKTDFLQAQVDYNMRRTERVRQDAQLKISMASLNELMGRDPSTPLDIDTIIDINRNLTLESITSGLGNNYTLQLARRNMSLAELNVRLFKSQQLPLLGFNSSYNFLKSESDANLLLSQRNLGFNLGLTASWTIFNGLVLNSRIRNAQINVQNTELQSRQTQLRVNTQAVQAFRTYQASIEALDLELQNVSLVKLNVEVAYEKYRQGTLNVLQLSEAESTFVDARTRLSDAVYAAKMAELNLMQLTGQLVK